MHGVNVVGGGVTSALRLIPSVVICAGVEGSGSVPSVLTASPWDSSAQSARKREGTSTMGIFDLESDYAIITVTDYRGRTLCKLIKEKPDSHWVAAGKPGSRKHLNRLIEAAQAGTPMPVHRKGHLAPNCLKQVSNGRWQLDVAGPELFWDKVIAVVDGFVAAGFTRRKFTVDQLYTATTYIK
jgi:hypothetical protein